MKLGPIARPLAVVGLTLGVLVLVMTLRAVLEARTEAALAARALEAADLDRAIVHLRTSARWYAPFNTYASGSLAELERLAQRAEQGGDHVRALRAYRAIHAAIHATRSFYTPHPELLARADERIAALMAAEPPAPFERDESLAERRARYLALLSPEEPRLFGVLLAFVGFATWVGSVVAFLHWGVDAEGRVLRRFGRRSLGFLLIGWIVFAVGLRIA